MKSSSSTSLPRRGPGRPREFDPDVALDRALLVFRERGYHAASMGDLSAAMKLTAGSIYKAFADKRAIFLAAFDRYVDLRHAQLQPLLDAERNGFGKLRALLRFYAETSHDLEGRRGCLVISGAAELATFDKEMAARVTAALQRVETLLRDLIGRGQADGSVPAALDRNATARALLCLVQGLRVVGKVGRSRADMIAAADRALQLLA
ncbi:MAG: TetR family transcriptional regulator [Rhodopseudomonas sp.]|nr:TetR family transcriptional regulator [Rhodopseudomonas sp.]